MLTKSQPKFHTLTVLIFHSHSYHLTLNPPSIINIPIETEKIKVMDVGQWSEKSKIRLWRVVAFFFLQQC
tara:strand:- start:258 stop:467 length:210 start_codon:yes stop_codon:yes gene_type:complete